MVSETIRPMTDDQYEIAPLSITEAFHVPIQNPSVTLSTDIISEDEALTVVMNCCKVAINNHAGRDVIYHTISALREL